jgi:hypothetical protein
MDHKRSLSDRIDDATLYPDRETILKNVYWSCLHIFETLYPDASEHIPFSLADSGRGIREYSQQNSMKGYVIGFPKTPRSKASLLVSMVFSAQRRLDPEAEALHEVWEALEMEGYSEDRIEHLLTEAIDFAEGQPYLTGDSAPMPWT